MFFRYTAALCPCASHFPSLLPPPLSCKRTGNPRRRQTAYFYASPSAPPLPLSPQRTGNPPSGPHTPTRLAPLPLPPAPSPFSPLPSAPNALAIPVADRMLLRVARPIPQGGEVTVSHLHELIFAPLQERRASLQLAYGYKCNCARCKVWGASVEGCGHVWAGVGRCGRWGIGASGGVPLHVGR